MRRKRRFGVYTNQTVKKGCNACHFFCQQCKGPCKMEYYGEIDENSIAINHVIKSKQRKLHQIGFGSIMPGKVFITIGKKQHRHPNKNEYGPYMNAHKIKEEIKSQIAESVHEFLTYR